YSFKNTLDSAFVLGLFYSCFKGDRDRSLYKQNITNSIFQYFFFKKKNVSTEKELILLDLQPDIDMLYVYFILLDGYMLDAFRLILAFMFFLSPFLNMF
ncbi:hypothetical protein ACJX0J_021660, partial [Zea mays]